MLIGKVGFKEMFGLWFNAGSAMTIMPLLLIDLRSRQLSERMSRAHP